MFRTIPLFPPESCAELFIKSWIQGVYEDEKSSRKLAHGRCNDMHSSGSYVDDVITMCDRNKSELYNLITINPVSAIYRDL